MFSQQIDVFIEAVSFVAKNLGGSHEIMVKWTTFIVTIVINFALVAGNQHPYKLPVPDTSQYYLEGGQIRQNIDRALENAERHGRQRLTVDVKYAHTPSEYTYLKRYHDLAHPLAGTRLGGKIGVPEGHHHYHHHRGDRQEQDSYGDSTDDRGHSGRHEYGEHRYQEGGPDDYGSPAAHQHGGGPSSGDPAYGQGPHDGYRPGGDLPGSGGYVPGYPGIDGTDHAPHEHVGYQSHSGYESTDDEYHDLGGGLPTEYYGRRPHEGYEPGDGTGGGGGYGHGPGHHQGDVYHPAYGHGSQQHPAGYESSNYGGEVNHDTNYQGHRRRCKKWRKSYLSHGQPPPSKEYDNLQYYHSDDGQIPIIDTPLIDLDQLKADSADGASEDPNPPPENPPDSPDLTGTVRLDDGTSMRKPDVGSVTIDGQQQSSARRASESVRRDQSEQAPRPEPPVSSEDMAEADRLAKRHAHHHHRSHRRYDRPWAENGHRYRAPRAVDGKQEQRTAAPAPPKAAPAKDGRPKEADGTAPSDESVWAKLAKTQFTFDF